jgi:hypothetical protein
MGVASTSVGAAVVVVVSALALGGCAVHAQEPVGYVEVSSAPYDVSVYPSTYYDGRTVYLVDDRWMYRDRGRWMYYRDEPAPLYRQRTIIRQAPPAYRPSYQAPTYQAPTYAPRGTAPPTYAPPATAPPAYPQRRYPAQPSVAPPARRTQ